MVRKLLVLGILPLITLIIFSSFVSAERGCCINPNADVRICTAEKIDSADCCPSPLEDYAGYYSQTGPIDPSDCLVNYFRANLDCSMVDECRVGCCCPDAVLSYKAACVPPRQFAEITEDVVDCPDLCEGLGEPPPGGECDKRPSSVEVVPTKGERELKVTWADECGADSVDVYRCSGYGCTDFAQLSTTVLPGYTDTSVYFDDGGNSGKYTYRIVAHYENDEGEYAATARGSLGNLECWKRYDERKFCIFESFYAQEPIKSYLDEQGVEQGSVELHTRFAGNFNHGFHCNSMNQLVFEKACGPGKICAVSGSQVQCLVESDCSTSRPFGLYSELTACESGNYCFYDKSKTTVNECYDCMPEMSCYDYKSEGACSGDNCRVGNCEWRATSEEIGVGVCVDLEKDNCRWCTEKGTAGMNNLDVFNLIFDACTEQKSNALSVEGYTCDVDLSCVYATCMDYGDTTACNKNGYIELDEDTNEITVKSDDHCGINVCKWFHALGCHKDADGDRRPDCSDEATADACEEDYFPPETTLFIHSTARINDIMRIIITDKQSVEDANADISQLPNSEDYTTYMCAYQDEDLCGPAKDFDFSTSERELAIIDLIEQELLRVGDNTLRYYTEDPAQNLEVVKVKDITIAVDHPLVFISSPRDGKVIGDTSVEVKGVVQDIAEITSARIIVNGVESPLSVSEGSFSTTVTLNEGLNTLYVEATNEYGEVGRSFPSTTVIVDMIPPNYSYIEPPNGYVGPGVAMINVAVYDKGGAGVDLEASEILLYNDLGSSISGSYDYNSESQKIYFALDSVLADGTYQIVIKLVDTVGNGAEYTSGFSVRQGVPLIVIDRPRNGYATSDSHLLIKGHIDDRSVESATLVFNSEEEEIDVANGIFTATKTMAEGTNTLLVKAENEIGEGSSGLFTVELDTTAPDPPVITYPTDGASFNTNIISVKGISEPDATLELFINEVSQGRFTANNAGSFTYYNAQLYLGSNTIYVKAYDATGNSADSVAVTVTLNTDHPVVVITAPKQNSYHREGILVKGIAEDSDEGIDSVSIYVNGQTNPVLEQVVVSNSEFSYSIPGHMLQEENEIYASATDSAGNIGKSSEVTAYLDDEAPYALVDPADGAVRREVDIVTASIDDHGVGGDIEKSTLALFKGDVEVSGEVYNNDNTLFFTPESELGDGGYEVRVTAIDLLDNEKQWVSHFTLDQKAPLITIDFPPNGLRTGASEITVRGRVDDTSIDGVEVVVNDVSEEVTTDLGRFELQTELVTGDNKILARATDSLGNEGGSGIVHAFLDREGPVATITIE